MALYKRIQLYQGEEHIDSCTLPLLVKGHPYIYVRMVAALLGRKVLLESGDSIVVGGDNNTVFHANSQKATIGGNTIDFGTSSMVVFGRIYIPLQAVEKVFGVVPEWDRSVNVITFPDANQLKAGKPLSPNTKDSFVPHKTKWIKNPNVTAPAGE